MCVCVGVMTNDREFVFGCFRKGVTVGPTDRQTLLQRCIVASKKRKTRKGKQRKKTMGKDLTGLLSILSKAFSRHVGHQHSTRKNNALPTVRVKGIR